MNWIVCLLAFLISFGCMLLVMPPLIDYLHKIKFGQTEREEGLESHKAKNGTPTMGGVAFILMPTLLFLVGTLLGFFRWNGQIGIILLAYIGYGIIGFIDDYIIVVKKDNEGLKPAHKFALQSILAILFFIMYINAPEARMDVWIPIVNVNLDLGYLYFILIFIMFTAETNAVNLTDGLDGLCSGQMMIALVPYIVFAYVQGFYSVVYLLVLVEGALLGYLQFNKHPAKIFMGDTGSLALGGLFAAVGMVLKQELLLVLIGGVFVAEVLSVMIQVTHYKRTKKRIFRMAPLHHHFEKGGWSETKVVRRFWTVGVILAILGLWIGVM